jgi:transposase
MMLSLPPSVRYFLYRQRTDMRKGFDGLSGHVRNELGRDPLTGDIFIFINGRRNQIKLLLFEGDGFSVYHKRLERGTYEIPKGSDDCLVLAPEQLQFILQGVVLTSVRRRKRFHLDQRKRISSLAG